jgi:translation initiation factor 2 subunit 1
MYLQEWPEVGEVVMCQVVECVDSGSYVELLEYNNIIGMVGVTQYSKQRIRNISKLMNVGKILPAQVLAVDKQNKYIDLSKKSLGIQDIEQCEAKFVKSKRVHSFVRQAACALKFDDETLIESEMLKIYTDVVWTIKRGDAHIDDILKQVTNEQFTQMCAGVDEELLARLLVAKSKVYKMEVMTFTGEVTLVCYSIRGIEATQAVLREIKQQTTSALKINYMSNSTYAFSCSSDDYEYACKLVNSSMEQAVLKMKIEPGGEGVIKELAVTPEEKQRKQNALMLALRKRDSDLNDLALE